MQVMKNAAHSELLTGLEAFAQTLFSALTTRFGKLS
jgi:hypothetical protein